MDKTKKHKYKNKVRCTTPHFSEEELKQITVNEINKLIKDKDSIIESCNFILNRVLQTKDLKTKEETLLNAVDKLSELLTHLVATNATTIQNQADYEEKYNKLSTNYSSTRNELKSLQAIIQDKNLRKSKINQFLNALKSQEEILIEFSSDLFTSLVDRIDVCSKDDYKIVFKNGYVENKQFIII